MGQMKILSFTADGLKKGLVTDSNPRFSFSYEGEMKEAAITIGEKTWDASSQLGVVCDGLTLQPFTDYPVRLLVTSASGETDCAELTFQTGRLDTPWQAKWITDGSYQFTEKKVSPQVMVFRKEISLKKTVAQALLEMTALGVYELSMNGQKVGQQYFAPGFTSYQHDLQYQTYDLTALLRQDNVLHVEVAGGWAVGSFVMNRVNRVAAPRQALLGELRIRYTDGTEELICTDEAWQVALGGPVQMADLYDGETYDAQRTLEQASYHAASVENVKIQPRITAEIGVPAVRHERFEAKYMTTIDGRDIYDFGQNFAGVVELSVKGRAGQTVTIRHAEILKENGDLNLAFLRTAKAAFTYVCKEGEQTYAPRFSYMGFRYISVEGAEKDAYSVCAYALYSDVQENGHFRCSNDLLNQLNQNISWGAKSNFVEIPTDCPQRDERMGWTGDIALFAPTACYQFDMARFLNKWLRDVRSEQFRGGGIPNTVPSNGYGFPLTMPNMAVDFWDDACVLVPWAVYMATGDLHVLETAFDSMEKYVEACKFWANLLSVGKHRYIWHTPSVFHFGDWVAPDVPKMSQWQGRSKWTATASLCNTSAILSKTAELLGKKDKAEVYRTLSRKVADAYQHLLMTEDGKLKGEEFQTGYVLPLYFGMLDETHKKAAIRHLVELVKKNDYCIGTGFPGTPYILFVLADNGYADVAYRMLENTKCPSWLYEVKVGATTIWERWDGLDEKGMCPIGDDGTGGMISYNHYASGAVGDFLYRRVLGIEALSSGYQHFAIRPLVGGGITWAEGDVMTPYGKIACAWRKENGQFTLKVTVPSGARCDLTLPSGKTKTLTAGQYDFSEKN